MHPQLRPQPVEPRSTALSPHRAVPVVEVAWNPALSTSVPDREIDINSQAFVQAAGRAGRLLDQTTYDSLIDFADCIDPGVDPGALLLRGVAVGDIGPTPSTPTDRTAKDSVSEFSLLTVARILGQPIGYIAEHGGNVVQNICPTPIDAARQTSTSSRVTLGFHTETAFHPHRSRYLLLLCLRGDPNALTSLCSIDEVLPTLPPAVRHALWEPRFRTRVDESFGGGPDGTAGAPAPVLSGSWDHPSMVFDAELMSGVDAGAAEALATLRRVIAERHTTVVLEAGDLLVIDNGRCVHGRSPFEPRFDGTDRWLQRTFVVTDLAASITERVGRVVHTRFAR